MLAGSWWCGVVVRLGKSARFFWRRGIFGDFEGGAGGRGGVTNPGFGQEGGEVLPDGLAEQGGEIDVMKAGVLDELLHVLERQLDGDGAEHFFCHPFGHGGNAGFPVYDGLGGAASEKIGKFLAGEIARIAKGAELLGGQGHGWSVDYFSFLANSY